MPAEPAHPAATPGPGTAQQSWHAPPPCCHARDPGETPSKCHAALRQDGELLTAATLAAGSRQNPAVTLGHTRGWWNSPTSWPWAVSTIITRTPNRFSNETSRY